MCLEKDPERRYASAWLLGEDLQRWLAGEPVTARSGPLAGALRLLRRRRRSAAAAVVVVGLLLAGAIVAGRSEPADPARLDALLATVARGGPEALGGPEAAAARVGDAAGDDVSALTGRLDAISAELEALRSPGSARPDPLAAARQAAGVGHARLAAAGVLCAALGRLDEDREEAAASLGRYLRCELDPERAARAGVALAALGGDAATEHLLWSRRRFGGGGPYWREVSAALGPELAAGVAELEDRLARLLAEGRARLESGDLAGAEEACDGADALDPDAALALRAEVRLADCDPDGAVAVADAAREDDARVRRVAARAHREADRLDEALAAADAAVALDPSAASFAVRAGIHVMRSEVAAAMADAERAVAADFGSWRAHVAVGRAVASRGLRGDWELADRSLARARELRPDSVRALRALGEHRSSKRPDEAWALLEEALAAARTPSERAVVRTSRAALLREQGDLEGALAEHEAALAAAPGYYWALVERANVLELLGDTEGALGDLDRVLAARPEALNARLSRASVRSAAGDYAGARADLDLVLAELPGNSAALLQRAWVRSASEDLPGALDDVREATRLDPDNPALWNYRGEFERAAGDLEAGLESLTRAIQLDPERPGSWVGRGQMRLHFAKEPVAAERDFTRALELDPERDVALFERAQARVELGRPRDALADLERAAQVAPGRAAYWTKLAKVRYDLGLEAEADASIAEAIRRCADEREDALRCALVLTRWAAAEERAGRLGDACRHLRQAVGLFDAGDPVARELRHQLADLEARLGEQ